MELKASVVGGVLLLAAASSGALTLGRVRGAAIVGQPLNVSIQVQLDGDETAASLCFEADVFHGDTRQDGSRVRITTEMAQQPQTANVLISSSAVVDEPVVTVYLRAGCSQKITRRYVLLADFPSDTGNAGAVPLVTVIPGASAPSTTVMAGPSAVVTPVAPASNGAPMAAGPVTQAAPAAPAAVRPPSPPKPKVIAKPVVREVPRKASPPPVAAPKPATPPSAPATAPAPKPAASAPVPAPAPAAAAQPRLKLDPVELAAEKIASLEASSASAPVDTAVRDAQRLQTLEGDLKSLLALAAKNETSLLDLQTRLQKAESERYSNPLVYGLGALLALCVGAIAYLMGRRRSRADDDAPPDDWRRRAQPTPSGNMPLTESMAAVLAQDAAPSRSTPLSAPAPMSKTVATRVDRTVAVAQAMREDGPLTQVDVSLLEMSESNFDQLMQTGTTHSAVRKISPPSAVMTPAASAMPRSLNSEELFDVRQQAEFFVSLGQTDQAVRVLENRIHDHGESSPLAYLDLLKIFYTTGLKTDFRQFREDFGLLFNVNVPEFASFAQEGKALEDYPEVFARISAAWPTSQVLSIIETSVYRDPRNERAERFDLGAFRELLMLHAVAQSVMSAAVASLQGDGSGAVPMAPLSMAAALASAPSFTRPGANPAPLPTLDSQMDEVDLDLDLDLTDNVQPATASTFDLMLPSVPATLVAGTEPVAKPDNNLLEFDASGFDPKLKLPGAP